MLFSGFPHGIPDLLVQGAAVAGRAAGASFYVDASINGGNSGGPVVDVESGRVVGQVYASRFLGAPELEELSDEAQKLAEYCARLGGGGGVAIMGIDFGTFAQAMARSNLLLAASLRANANTGIGLARDIAPLLDAARPFDA